MKYKMLALICFIPFCLFAQKKDYSEYPGNARFQELKNLKSYGRVTEINLDENIFRMIDYENMEDGRELKKLLRPIKGIILYTIDDIKKAKADSLRFSFRMIDSALTHSGWNKLIETDEEREQTSVFVRYSDSHQVIGLAITSLSGYRQRYRANLVNIMGDIDMSTIGKVGRKFKLPALGKEGEEKTEESDDGDE